jgi:WD40 repeat protein
MEGKMKDERAHLQLFDLIARDWTLDSPSLGITFNTTNTAVAFGCADGSVRIAATADKSSPNLRVRRAADTARLTISPRVGKVAPLKIADFTDGRTSPVVAYGADHFAFAKSTGRINNLTPGGIAVHLAVKAPGPITAVASHGDVLAYVCGDTVMLADNPLAILPQITAIAFSSDGRSLAVAHDQGVSRWDMASLDTGPVHSPMAGGAVSLTWQASGDWLAAAIPDGFCMIDCKSNCVIHHGNFPSPVRHLAFSRPTDTIVASGAFRVAAWSLPDQTDVMSGKPGLVLIDAVATCPSRNLVAVGYANGLLSLAEIGRPSEILLREDTGAGVTAMAWSGCGTYLAVAGTDGSAALVEFPDSMFKS